MPTVLQYIVNNRTQVFPICAESLILYVFNFQGKWYLEDPSGAVQLDLSKAISSAHFEENHYLILKLFCRLCNVLELYSMYNNVYNCYSFLKIYWHLGFDFEVHDQTLQDTCSNRQL